MRIAYISYEFPPDTGKGGIGTYVKQSAVAMAGRGCDVHVFAGSCYRTCDERMDGYWVHWLQCIDSNDFRHKVVNPFTTQQDIAGFNLVESPEINGNAWEIKKAFKDIPLVVRLHAPDYLVESLKKKYVPFTAKLRYVLGALRRLTWDAGYWRSYRKESDADYQFTKLANAITAPSEAMKNWAVKYWQLPPEKIQVIPNIFRAPEALLKIPIQETACYKRVVFFGRLNVLKGLVNATMAMKKILTEYPDWNFRVIGDDGPGPYAGTTMRTWMQQQLKDVQDRVTFLDGLPSEKLPAVIADSEIALLPSLFESFSYACAEMMAAGKAVVASKHTGMADLIENNNTGTLADPENVSEMYTVLKYLIQHDKIRYRIALNARKSIATKYNAEKLAEKMIDFYKTVTFKSQ